MKKNEKKMGTCVQPTVDSTERNCRIFIKILHVLYPMVTKSDKLWAKARAGGSRRSRWQRTRGLGGALDLGDGVVGVKLAVRHGIHQHAGRLPDQPEAPKLAMTLQMKLSMPISRVLSPHKKQKGGGGLHSWAHRSEVLRETVRIKPKSRVQREPHQHVAPGLGHVGHVVERVYHQRERHVPQHPEDGVALQNAEWDADDDLPT